MVVEPFVGPAFQRWRSWHHSASSHLYHEHPGKLLLTNRSVQQFNSMTLGEMTFSREEHVMMSLCLARMFHNSD